MPAVIRRAKTLHGAYLNISHRFSKIPQKLDILLGDNFKEKLCSTNVAHQAVGSSEALTQYVYFLPSSFIFFSFFLLAEQGSGPPRERGCPEGAGSVHLPTPPRDARLQVKNEQCNIFRFNFRCVIFRIRQRKNISYLVYRDSHAFLGLHAEKGHRSIYI